MSGKQWRGEPVGQRALKEGSGREIGREKGVCNLFLPSVDSHPLVCVRVCLLLLYTPTWLPTEHNCNVKVPEHLTVITMFVICLFVIYVNINTSTV